MKTHFTLLSFTMTALLPTALLTRPGLTSQSDGGAWDEEDIDTVVVTGTRIPTPLDQIGRSVSVISAAEIEVRQQRFLYDVLQAAPGVQVTRTGSFGSLATVSIRGLDSDQTLVVQDGVVLNNPASFGNGFNFANFDTSDIERIEVIRGAQSTLYGSDAIGGVINIVTKDGGDGFGGSGFIEGGSFATLRGAATVRGGSEKLSGRLTVAGVTTDGFSSADEAAGNTENDGFENLTVSAKGRWQPVPAFRVETLVRYQTSENEFDSFEGVPIDGDEISDSEEWTAGAFATLDMLSGALSHRASVTYTRVDQFNTREDEATFDSLGTRISYEYQGTARPVDWATLTFGGEYDEQEAETRVGFGGDQEIDTESLYGLLQVRPHERVTLSAGVRYDSVDVFGSETTFNAAGSARIPGVEVTLRGSYSEGFRAPTAGELGFNPDLFAEFSDGWDIGLERSFLDDRIRVGVTYFDQHIDDLIAFDLADFTFRNIEEFDSEGVEIYADVQVNETLTVNLAYTHLDATNVTTTNAAVNQPDDRFNAEIAWAPTDRLTLSTNVQYNGTEIDGVNRLDDFIVVNLRGEYALTDRFDVTLRVENLTDENYQDNFGYGTAPLSAFGGLRARF
ncbi:TonB-dependent receptor plug domain-containing protein [Eilatimonas milleporae]|uniref:Vitamin B12 transporter n=1 Tax=Eilatimonas milleporae TaxID=911205 RepID=A0A3M0CHB8_9PROT|nr:TonB-dependent receptor [Eilatimonas milleporae]RMB08732.1 vitamin B12 transporter [Eilatimonas milleporae]